MEKTLQCPSCKTLNFEDANFCTMCGHPITANAIVLDKQRKTTHQLELLNSLINIVEDVKTLNTLKEYTNKLSK